jgi:hypothetical protein
MCCYSDSHTTNLLVPSTSAITFTTLKDVLLLSHTTNLLVPYTSAITFTTLKDVLLLRFTHN